jgi:hypothetical protein
MVQQHLPGGIRRDDARPDRNAAAGPQHQISGGAGEHTVRGDDGDCRQELAVAQRYGQRDAPCDPVARKADVDVTEGDRPGQFVSRHQKVPPLLRRSRTVSAAITHHDREGAVAQRGVDRRRP